MRGLGGPEVIDLVDGYVAWRETAVAVRDAHDHSARPSSVDGALGPLREW